jgi:hypothetical protein
MMVNKPVGARTASFVNYVALALANDATGDISNRLSAHMRLEEDEVAKAHGQPDAVYGIHALLLDNMSVSSNGFVRPNMHGTIYDVLTALATANPAYVINLPASLLSLWLLNENPNGPNRKKCVDLTTTLLDCASDDDAKRFQIMFGAAVAAFNAPVVTALCLRPWQNSHLVPRVAFVNARANDLTPYINVLEREILKNNTNGGFHGTPTEKAKRCQFALASIRYDDWKVCEGTIERMRGASRLTVAAASTPAPPVKEICDCKTCNDSAAYPVPVPAAGAAVVPTEPVVIPDSVTVAGAATVVVDTVLPDAVAVATHLRNFRLGHVPVKVFLEDIALYCPITRAALDALERGEDDAPATRFALHSAVRRAMAGECSSEELIDALSVTSTHFVESTAAVPSAPIAVPTAPVAVLGAPTSEDDKRRHVRAHIFNFRSGHYSAKVFLEGIALYCPSTKAAMDPIEWREDVAARAAPTMLLLAAVARVTMGKCSPEELIATLCKTSALVAESLSAK